MVAVAAKPLLASTLYSQYASTQTEDIPINEQNDDDTNTSGFEGEFDANHREIEEVESGISPHTAGNASRRVQGQHGADAKIAKTGCKAVDEALNGGLVFSGGGTLACLCGEEQEPLWRGRSGGGTAGGGDGRGGKKGGWYSAGGVNEICQSFLISHILSHPTATATIIDSKGTFNVLELHRGIMARMKKASRDFPGTEGANVGAVGDGLTAEEVDIKTKAAQKLDRVKIMRVFDFDGMVEGIAEMRDELEAKETPVEVEEEMSNNEASPAVQDERQDLREELLGIKRVKSTIADSQQIEGDEEIEMMLDDLLDEEVYQTGAPGPGEQQKQQKSPQEEQQQEDESPPTRDPSPQANNDQKHHMLIIDNLTHLIAPIMKRNYIQGQALLSSFLRSLAHTARQHDICVLILNATLRQQPTSSTSSTSDNTSTAPAIEPGPSAFASAEMKVRPALGKALGYLVDVSLLIHRLSGGEEGKRERGGGGGSRKTGNREGRGEVGVMEVVQDREGGRVGRMGLFRVDGEGSLVDAF